MGVAAVAIGLGFSNLRDLRECAAPHRYLTEGTLLPSVICFLHPQFLEQRQGLTCYLIHVVVLVRFQPAYEVDRWSLFCQGFVPFVDQIVLRTRDGVVRIALSLRIFIHDARLRMLLTRQVLEFGDACVQMLVRIIDHGLWLKYGPIDGLVLEAQRTIRQLAVSKLEELIDRSG